MLFLALRAGVVLWNYVQADPGFPMLISQHGADWIRFDRPYRFYAQYRVQQATRFRTSFEVEQRAPDALLTVHAYRGARVYLDGRPLNDGKGELSWKKPLQLLIGPYCPPGQHSLEIVVINGEGPPALMAWCDEFDLKTGSGWEASDAEGSRSLPARPLDVTEETKLARSFPLSFDSLRSQLPLLVVVFGSVFAVVLLRGWNLLPAAPLSRWLDAAPFLLRWTLLLFWIVLGVNNLPKLPLVNGFDSSGHQKYIQFLIEHEELPYANDGWQMFQTPLYYIASTAMVALLLWQDIDINIIWQLLRVIPFACGALQVEWCYRALRHAFPGRADLQSLGLLLGGLMPMNIYISFGYTNEPMAGMFSALAVLWIVKAFRQPALARTLRLPIILGLLLGLAILSKFTAVLLIPPLTLSLIFLVKPAGWGRVTSSLFSFALAACLACGWYFIRNSLKFGKPFVGGWDPVREIEWWQDPGYRSLDQVFSFGRSLVQPIYAATHSFLDGLYATMWLDGYLSGAGFSDRPPWNYPYVIGMAVLSLPPTLAILTGIATSLGNPDRAGRQILLFSSACVGIYMAAIFYLFLTLPIVSTTKASYMVGIIPCFAILFASGVERLLRWPVPRAAVYGWMACWALFAYAGYFVIAA